MKRAICVFLTALMLIPALAACSGGDKTNAPATTTAAATDAATVLDTAPETTTELPREKTPDTLPEKLDFNAVTVNVMFPTSSNGDQTRVDWYAEDKGDIVSSAVYARQVAVEERLNIKYNVLFDETNNAYLNRLRTDITSGTGAYDVVWGSQYQIAKLVVESMYRDMADAKYIDYSQPWWNTDYMDEITISGRRFLLEGDVTLSAFAYSSCFYVNKTQFNNVTGEKADDLYQTVLDRKWTMDKLAEYCQKSYKDANGDGASDINDNFGFGSLASSDTDHFTIDAGIRFTDRNAKDEPVLCLNNEKTIKYTEKLYNLLYENPGVTILAANQTHLDVTFPNKFMNNEFTFMYGWLYSANLLRDMKEDYGIIPFPLYEEGEDYRALVHDAAHLVVVPVSCTKVDAVAATLEATAAENYRTVTTAYYEVALKTKYTRDAMSGQIIDIIHDGMTTDFAYVYNYILNNYGITFRTLMKAQNKNFASYYAENQEAFQSKLNDLIAAFAKIN